MTFAADSCALLSSRLFSCIFRKSKFLCNSAGNIHMAKSDDVKTTMEITSIPPIVATFRQALHTFNDNNKCEIETNMNKLKLLMDRLTAEDLGFNKDLSNPLYWELPYKAPCTYIEVFQNSLLNMSIFVLKPGFKMPMHDHPHMYGMLKVISGAVNIKSYSEYPLNEEISEIDFETRARFEAARIARGVHTKRRLFAKITNDRVCKANSQCCVLTPTISNFHEIEALGEPAAFFDILSPPYDSLIAEIGPRKCGYYFVSNEISTNLVELEEMEVPKCFYCDQQPYLGPILT